MAHTPGPWQIGGGCLRPHHERSIVRGPNREYIARVAGGIPENDYDNRFLIAAAPDLLEALVMVRDADDDNVRDGGVGIPWPARNRINCAIAKAEGRA